MGCRLSPELVSSVEELIHDEFEQFRQRHPDVDESAARAVFLELRETLRRAALGPSRRRRDAPWTAAPREARRQRTFFLDYEVEKRRLALEGTLPATTR